MGQPQTTRHCEGWLPVPSRRVKSCATASPATLSTASRPSAVRATRPSTSEAAARSDDGAPSSTIMLAIACTPAWSSARRRSNASPTLSRDPRATHTFPRRASQPDG
eukprot:scaffold135850_cov33-Tisochrysis_lutea.AAC.3